MTDVVMDETYGDHCGSGEIHGHHDWRDSWGSVWFCMGTFKRGTK